MMGALGFWGWLGLGLLLIAGELLLVPGGFLLWVGIAAILVGLVEILVPLGWVAELVLFAVLCLVAVLAGLRISRARTKEVDGLLLNDRLEGLRGQVFPLDAAISNGYGRIRVHDSVWRVHGPNLPAGAAVRVTGIDGATLVVEAAGQD
jgi:membrane protein implicated in regulation of membrane protease activity